MCTQGIVFIPFLVISAANGFNKNVDLFQSSYTHMLDQSTTNQVDNTLNPNRSYKAAWWEKKNGRMGKVTCVGQT